MAKRKGIYLSIPMFSEGLLIRKRLFQDGAMPKKYYSFHRTLPTNSEGPLFSSCTSKASLQKKIMFFITLLYNLRQSSSYNRRPTALMRNSLFFQPSLSRKHGLATFVHEQKRYSLLNQSPPISEIDWLCVDVDGYKIVNVYKLLRRDCNYCIS